MVLARFVWAACLLVCLPALGQTAGGNQRRAVVAAATRYVGTPETGNNRGAVVALFMTPYGYGAGTAYCGLFLHRVYQDARVPHGVKGPALAANWSIPASAIIARRGRLTRGVVPQAGDIAIFSFGGRRIDHVELILAWPADENYCYVIGGNTSNPHNPRQQGVFAKTRLKAEMLVADRISFQFNSTTTVNGNTVRNQPPHAP